MSDSETSDDTFNVSVPDINTDMLNNQTQNLLDLSHIQQNINTFYKTFSHDLTFVYRSVPLTFFIDYAKYKLYENSQKIIVPKEILNKLAEYENLELPIFVKINDCDKVFGIIEYVDFIEFPQRISFDTCE